MKFGVFFKRACAPRLGMALLSGGNSYDIAYGMGMGALSAMAMSAFIGGVTGGVGAAANNGNFWTGKGMRFEFGVSSGPKDQIKMSIEMAEAYNNSEEMKWVDYGIYQNMQREVGFENGMFGVENPTSHSGKHYGYLSDGYYQKIKDGARVAGYYDPDGAKMHISKGVAIGDLTTFRATVRHELIHAYHYYKFGPAAANFTEALAYQDTYYTYLQAGYYGDAFKVTLNPNFSWKKYPFMYYFNP